MRRMVADFTGAAIQDIQIAKMIDLELCQRYVEEIVLLTETEIEKSIRLLFEQHRLVVEGSGALGVGGLLKRKERFKGKKVVAAVCGRNIDLEVFKRIIA